jgi:hypothetical protein
VHNKKLFVLGGFDGQKWLADLHVLDVSKLEECEIASHSVSHLLRDLSTLINNADSFPDVRFRVEGGRELVAHRAILCARSAHFRTMFGSEWRERNQPVVDFPDWSHAAFLACLTFLYTGRVHDLPPEVAVDVLSLADHLGLDGLRQLCASSLMHAIEPDTVCSLISHAHRCGAAELKAACLDFLLKRHAEVDYSSLKSEPELLVEVLGVALGGGGGGPGGPGRRGGLRSRM